MNTVVQFMNLSSSNEINMFFSRGRGPAFAGEHRVLLGGGGRGAAGRERSLLPSGDAESTGPTRPQKQKEAHAPLLWEIKMLQGQAGAWRQAVSLEGTGTVSRHPIPFHPVWSARVEASQVPLQSSEPSVRLYHYGKYRSFQGVYNSIGMEASPSYCLGGWEAVLAQCPQTVKGMRVFTLGTLLFMGSPVSLQAVKPGDVSPASH